MANYSDIRGYRVKYLASDPTLNTSTEGQVWYNSTEGVLKSLVQIKAWSAGANMATARRLLGAAGTQTAALGFGGGPAAGPAVASTEEYSGYTWSNGGNLGTARDTLWGSGTQTAGLAFGGNVPPGASNQNATEEYDGSAWTTGGNLGTARRGLAGTGTQTSTVAFGGVSTSVTGVTEEYNGTSWTANPTGMNVARVILAAAGTQTAALGFGGQPPTGGQTEEYDGSTWTVVNAMNTARDYLAGCGTQTAAIGFGGGPTSTGSSATEQYDGTSWNTVPSLATARYALGGSGTNTASLAFGGAVSTTVSAATEEYNSNINAITKAAWASGANMPANTNQGAGSGTQTAALITGGKTGPGGGSLSTQTVEYNGSAWTAGGAYPAPSTQMGAFGIQTATVCMGGDQPSQSPTVTNVANAYNGTSWTSINAMNNYRYNIVGQGVGVQTAGLIAGGDDGITSPVDDLSAVEEYNGSTWTAVSALSTARGGSSVNIGTQTACIAAYGTNPGAGGPPGFPSWFDNTEIYNGSVWTAGPKTNTLRRGGIGSSGTLTNGIAFGGYFNPITYLNTSEKYDGTSWVSSANLATARSGIGSADSSGDAALGAGGEDGGVTSNAVEEFTGEIQTVTASTLTTS
jgi:hypothetical protein